MNSRPGQSYSVGGFRPTGRFRIRIAWFLLPVVEELYEYIDGTFKWKRLEWMRTVEFKPNREHW